MKKLALFFVLLVVLGGIALYITESKKEVNAPIQNTPGQNQNKPTDQVYVFDAAHIKTETLSYKQASVVVTVEYPQFTDVPENSIAAAINTSIKTKANDLYEKNRTELESNVQEFKRMNVDMSDRELVFERKIQAGSIYINSNTQIFSLSYTNYYDGGGAHGTFFYQSENFNLTNGGALALDSMLQGNYKSALTTYVTNAVKKPTKDCENCDSLGGEIADFASSSIVSDQFTLNNKGLTLLYSAYDLGPYVSTSGGQRIFVPKENLKEFIKRDW